MSYLEVLERWNRWGNGDLEAGLNRDITPSVVNACDIQEQSY